MKSHPGRKPRSKPAKAAVREQPATRPIYRLEAEVVEGLEAIAAEEISRRFPTATIDGQGRGAIRFSYRGDLKALERLRMVQAVYLVAYHAVPRPKALLGDQHFRVVMSQINTIRALTTQNNYRTLFLSAAGTDTPIMQRLVQALADATNLSTGDDKGDLWIRVRRSADRAGWETLVRLTARPLTTRSWRVCNFEGALNATVAHAMTQLAQIRPQDRVLNLMCGSGSLLIEQADTSSNQILLGIDNASEALRCAQTNITASGISANIRLALADTTQLPLPDNSFDILLADLPFGQRIGSHEQNLTLYPRVLTEAARIITPEGQFIAITHEANLLDRLLRASTDWQLQQSLRITLRGLHPRIYTLKRRSA